MTITSPSRQTLANPSNAVKKSLTGRTVLLPGDDVEAYQRHLDSFAARFQPSGDRETELVQSLADTQWRLNRIPTLEAGIYAIARIEMADLFPEEAPAVRAALIQARTYLTYTRQLNNLHLQEARLRRHYEKDLAELRSLQSQRQSVAEQQVSTCGRVQPSLPESKMASNFQAASSPSTAITAYSGGD